MFQTLDRTARYPYAGSEYARRVMWAIVQSTLFRLPLPRAYAWRTMLLRMFGAQIDKPAAVASTTRIMHPWLLKMGRWSNIAGGVTIYNLGFVTIGEHSVISQDAYICAGTHDYTNPTMPLERPPIKIGDGVWIAACAFVGPGVTIGDNSVIGARAVVTKDVPPGVVAAGNPCHVIKERNMSR